MPRKYRKGWSIEEVLAVRTHVKKQLDEIELAEGRAERAKTYLRQIAALASEATSESILKLYTLIVSALVFEARYPFLSPRQKADFSQLAFDLLSLRGIEPRNGRLSFLWSETHLALSMIHRSEGNSWAALWEQQVAFLSSAKGPINGRGAHSIFLGVRAIRAGQAGTAIASFRQARTFALTPSQEGRALVGEVNALRLSAELDEAKDIAEAAFRLDLDHEIRTELNWELGLIAAARNGEIASLGPLVKQPEMAMFRLDYFFLAHTCREMSYLKDLPAAQTLRGAPGRMKPQEKAYVAAAMQIQKCYDTMIPFERRFQNLGKCFEDLASIVTIDKELQILAAAARWLYRSDQEVPAKLILNEYRSRCLKLTSGTSKDVFGLLGNVPI